MSAAGGFGTYKALWSIWKKYPLLLKGVTLAYLLMAYVGFCMLFYCQPYSSQHMTHLLWVLGVVIATDVGGWLMGQIVIQCIEFNYAAVVVLALRGRLWCAHSPKANADRLR